MAGHSTSRRRPCEACPQKHSPSSVPFAMKVWVGCMMTESRDDDEENDRIREKNKKRDHERGQEERQDEGEERSREVRPSAARRSSGSRGRR